MKLNLKSAIGGAAVAAVAGGIMLAGATAAFAAPPSFEPDPGSVGSVAFYNAAGAPITSGLVSDSPLAAYYGASGGGIVAGDNKANVVYATPQDGVATQSWTTTETWTSTQTFGPGVVYPGSLAGTSNAVVHGVASDGPFSDHIAAFANASAANPGVYQIRIYTTQAGGGGNATYYSSDIKVTGTTWVQVFPAPVTATATTLTASPNPSTAGSTVTLTATETPAAAGSVQFKDGAANIGAPVAVNGGGVATTTTSSLTAGSHSLSAVFTPTDLTSFSGSTGTFTATVNPPATPTATTLAVCGGYLTAGSDATLTANVTGPGSTPNGSGAVAFYDNNSATAIAGTVTPGPTGTYTLNLPTGFAAGPHSIVAKFTPTDVTVFQVSQSAPSTFTTGAVAGSPCAQPGSVCTDQQNIEATVPVGTLVIDTPYTRVRASGPRHLGAEPGLDHVRRVEAVPEHRGHGHACRQPGLDRPSHCQPAHRWRVKPEQRDQRAERRADRARLNTRPGFTGTVVATDNPAANGVAPADPGSLGLGGTAPHTVATANNGLGTVTMNGTLTLNAPSSTEAGLFTGTITFTVG